jgi:hypothetical protein
MGLVKPIKIAGGKLKEIVAGDTFSGTFITESSFIKSVAIYSGTGNITAVAGTCYDIPVGTLAANINFDLTAIITSLDYIEIANRSDSFRIIYTGQLVYMADGTTQTDVLAWTVTRLRMINGKITIL